MKKSLSQSIEIPKEVTVLINETTVTIKGVEGENSRTFNLGKVNIKLADNKIILSNEKSTKTEKKIMNTVTAHIKNMIKGVQKKFVYELKICSGHFPMNVKKEGNTVIIKNFLGEKVNRTAKIIPGVEVEINKNEIIVKSIDKELSGQTAANFEKATIVRGRDKRIFQDGIYIIKKAGKEI